MGCGGRGWLLQWPVVSDGRCSVPFSVSRGKMDVLGGDLGVPLSPSSGQTLSPCLMPCNSFFIYSCLSYAFIIKPSSADIKQYGLRPDGRPRNCWEDGFQKPKDWARASDRPNEERQRRAPLFAKEGKIGPIASFQPLK